MVVFARAVHEIHQQQGDPMHHFESITMGSGGILDILNNALNVFNGLEWPV